MKLRMFGLVPMVALAYNRTNEQGWYQGEEGGDFGTGAGVGGSFGVGVGVGVGGDGDQATPAPPSVGEEESEPICNESEQPNVDPTKEVVCRKRAWGVDCMIACAEEGLACPAQLKHPYSPSSGYGNLWKCSGETNAEMCKYVYDNGDECTWDRGNKKKFCKYSN